MSIDSLERRSTAAKILAAAVSELFPDATLLHEEATSLCYFCDFAFPFTFQKEMIPLIEERMRSIIKENREIKILEMIPSNAAAYFAHHLREDKAEEVIDLDLPLVTVFQMGNYVDLCQGDFLSSSGQIEVFKLLEVGEKNEQGQSVTRILGEVYSDKQELKESLKNRKDLLKSDHVQKVQELQLLVQNEESQWCWMPKGEALREILIDFWKKELIQQNFQFVSSAGFSEEEILASHIDLYKKLAYPQIKLAECRQVFNESANPQAGLLDPAFSFRDYQHLFCQEPLVKQELISSLQFIIKISKIFNFEHKVFLCTKSAADERAKSGWKKSADALLEALRLCHVEYVLDKETKVSGPRIELRTKDALGREWTSSSLSIECVLAEEHDLPVALVARSVFISLERFTALLLEKEEGRMPFRLVPEQVRIFAVGAEAEEEAAALRKSWSALGMRIGLDCRQEKLGTRLSLALSEKVPYLVVLGNREKGSGKIAVRALSWKKEEMMGVEEFTQKLLTEMTS